MARSLTPYQFASNTPIEAIDLDGGEARHITMHKGVPIESMPSDVLRHRIPIGSYMPSLAAAEGGMANGFRTGAAMGATVLVVASVPLIASSATATVLRIGWWALANPQSATGVAITILSTIGGYDGPDVPGVGDDFATMGRKGYENLVKKGITSSDELAPIARNSYNAIIGTIDEEIKGLGSLELKAKKAFEIRNNAKDFARELSGPELKAKAEAKSVGSYGDAKPSFDLLFNKNKGKVLQENPNLRGQDLVDKVYEKIIDGSKRTNEEINKTYGAQ